VASVFISHRKQDRLHAERLAEAIERAGHSVWFDEWRINVGDSIVKSVDAGLAGSTYLVLCLSSFGMSDWVDREWMSTVSRQLEGHRVKLLPVRLTGGKLPAIIDDFACADLVNDWNLGVARLLKSIR